MAAPMTKKRLSLEVEEQRRHHRIERGFPLLIWVGEAAECLAGTTVDLSQSGAFIRTEDWHHFRVGDQALLICTLPAEFSGQDRRICIRGKTLIRRIDGRRMGIAVEFSSALKAFERVDAPSWPAGNRASLGLCCPACPELVAGNLRTYEQVRLTSESRGRAG